MKKFLLFLSLLSLLSSITIAQSGTVSGTIKDELGESIPGVSITLKGSSKGTISNNDGAFIIMASPDDVLMVSSVGFISIEVKVGNKKNINLVLRENASLLDEVVVSGYGIETLKKDISGAVSKIDKSTLKNTAPVSASELLQGRAAGVNIVSNDGTPGAGFSINIRGTSSISAGGAPLIVIDNVPYITNSNSDTNPLATINPNDIESIDILKDASATALYGVGATNGVIVITTKRGVVGKPVINFSVKQGMGTFARKLPTLSPQDYAMYKAGVARSFAGDDGRQSGYINSPGFPGMWEMLASPSIEGFSDIDFGPILQNQYGVTNTEGTNWLDVITQNTSRKMYDLDFSGATDQGTNYFGSLGYTDEKGVLINSGFKRLSGRLNIDQKIGKFISAGLRLQYTNTDYEGLIGDWRSDNAIAQSNFMNPFINRDNVVGASQGLINNGGQGAAPESPEFRLNQTISNRGSDWFSGNLNLSVKPTSWLEIALTGGLINENSQRNYFVSRVLREASNTNGRAEIENANDSRWTLQPRISINKKYKGHKINGTFVYEGRKQYNDKVYTRYEQFSTEVLKNYTLSAAGQILSIPTFFDIRDRSYIARTQYDYKSKYILTASARIDESSRFLNDRRGIFPAISAAWNISDEKFMDFASSYLSALKLRGGFGITGNNQIPVNSGLQLASIGTVGYPFNNAVTTAVTPSSRFANPDITWETTKGLNFGLDMGFFNDRIGVSTNLYKNVTNGLLLDIQLPAYSSFSSAVKNLGSLQNTGFEFELTSRNINTKNLKWSTNFNIAWNRNKITDLGGQPELGFTVIGTGANLNDVVLRVGQPIGVYYGTIQDGLINNDIERFNSAPKVQDNNTGEFGFVDLNGNGDITRTEYVPIAYTMPKNTGGMGNTVTYKNIDLYAFFRWSYGNDVVNNNINRAMYLRGDNNPSEVIANDIWNRQNEDRNYQSYYAIFTTRSGSTFSRSEMVEDGSFLRFETLRLGYNIPSSIINKAKINRAKITFTGQNLAVWTRYSWFDPEVNAARGNNKNLFPGLDQGSYPRSRFYLLGVELGF